MCVVCFCRRVTRRFREKGAEKESGGCAAWSVRESAFLSIKVSAASYFSSAAERRESDFDCYLSRGNPSHLPRLRPSSWVGVTSKKEGEVGVFRCFALCPPFSFYLFWFVASSHLHLLTPRLSVTLIAFQRFHCLRLPFLKSLGDVETFLKHFPAGQEPQALFTALINDHPLITRR